ncbi:MAG: DEAD/DEAH box helicase [Bdellovibrionota bacterium]
MNLAQMLLDAEERLAAINPLLKLRPQQSEVLTGLARGQNVFAALPTGYGKSLCYWLPAAAWNWRVWVISPLVSLMEDQVAACTAVGVEALAIHSASAQASQAKLFSGKWQVLIISPERMGQWGESGVVAELEAAGLLPDLLVLDEMHCFEDWRRFRVGYQAVFAPIRRLLAGGAQLLGLSASFGTSESDAWMLEFCAEYLRVETPIARENLSLLVIPIAQEYWRWILLVAFLRQLSQPESALIYCSSQRECDEVSQWLQSAGFPAVAYHAGLPALTRRERSRAFRAGFLRIICATSAFGMGIDYAHVGRVLHFSLPYDLPSYWQEVGRAGRNGDEAYGVALWRRSEIVRFRRLDREQGARYASLWAAWARGVCRKIAVAEYLGVEQEECGKCDRCRSAKGGALPSWLQEWQFLFHALPWWLEPEAEPLEWLKNKVSAYGLE